MKILSVSLGIFILVSILPLRSQDRIYNSSITGVCYAGNKIKRIYIPPPDAFLKKSGTKSGGSVKIYYTGFTSQGEIAMEYAKSILETMLPADTKLTILASWEKITTAGVLANCSPTYFVKGSAINALNPQVYYPIALAEKIAGKSLDGDLEGDLTLRINSSMNWYLGTDGNTPTLKYDLVTVALHEICHGLGFFDSMSTDGTLGAYGGQDTLPTIYDTFVEDLYGIKLTDTLEYINPSASLHSQFTGGNLYFNGPLLKKYSSGSRAKLYTPSKWEAGSSISHLDEEPVTLQENALMTPFIDKGEAIHDPGKYTFSILGDLGWINTRIIHNPKGDTEDHLPQILLSTTIKSDTLYNHDKMGVVYSLNKFQTKDTIFMTSPNSDNSFITSINIPSYNSELQYYFFAQDSFLRLYKSPSKPDSVYRTFIGTDTVKPELLHTPEKYYLESVDTINFVATATDNLAIDSVFIEYKLNNGSSQFIGMNAGDSGSFRSFLNAKPELLKGIDSIQYRVFAVDSALTPNTAVLPEKGFFVSKIEHLESILSSYATDFSDAAPHFLNNGFDVLKPADFTKYGLHSKHPYESPMDNLKSISYTALLRHPLKLSESGLLINFNEIVLVEPGLTGSVFGSSDFFDYVVLEGSKNFGKTWLSLADGYDSRLVSSWLIAYKSSLVGDNSTFIGSESMLNKHTIYYHPSDKISAGDTLLIRFSLFSDPFANGWGWAIEDLRINPLVDDVEKINDGMVKVYPNPGTGLIKMNLSNEGNDSGKPFRYSIFNSAGICIKSDHSSGNSEVLADISGNPTGLYFIILYRDDGILTIKYSLIK